MSLALKLALAPVLVAQAVATRARMPRLPEAAGDREGAVGRGRALRVLIAGDSSAAGVGVDHQREALAGHLARTLAARAKARVQWRLVARSGVTSAQCIALLDEAHAAQPLQADLAVLVLGVNDVVDQVPSHRAVEAREALANRLRNVHGVAHVAFAPLPPVHRFPGLPQPLRWIAGADARRHDDALRDWAAARAGDVSHVPIDYALEAAAMAHDGFHPGPAVYRACGEAIAHHLAAWLAAHPLPLETTA
jgi:lysophospholipase L1-like esterase